MVVDGDGTPGFVSVIVPVYEDLDRLLICLEALERQTYPTSRYDVWVVDNGLEPTIMAATKRFEHVICIHEAKPGSFGARNTGVAASYGDIVAFTDADCIPSDNWLEEGIKALESLGGAGAVGGEISVFAQDSDRPTAPEVYEIIYGFSQRDCIEREKFAVTANLIMPRDVFYRVGQFDHRLTSGGDKEWGQKADALGIEIAFAPDAIVGHPARQTIKQIHNRQRRFLGGQHMSDVRSLEGGHLYRLAKCLTPPITTATTVYKDPVMRRYRRRLGVFWILYSTRWVNFYEGLRLALGGSPLRK